MAVAQEWDLVPQVDEESAHFESRRQHLEQPPRKRVVLLVVFVGVACMVLLALRRPVSAPVPATYAGLAVVDLDEIQDKNLEGQGEDSDYHHHDHDYHIHDHDYHHHEHDYHHHPHHDYGHHHDYDDHHPHPHPHPFPPNPSRRRYQPSRRRNQPSRRRNQPSRRRVWHHLGDADGASDTELGDDEGVDPDEALSRFSARKTFAIEGDLRKVVKEDFRPLRGGSAVPNEPKLTPDQCRLQASMLFDQVVAQSPVQEELTAVEKHSFRERFALALAGRCKELRSEKDWIDAASHEFQKQKPIMTEAVAEHLNAAKLGFKTKMHGWLLQLSEGNSDQRLGLLQDKDSSSVLQRPNDTLRGGARLPRRFRSWEKWGHCRTAIMRIDNQGHCGSCWAFAAMGTVDSRLCIASGGRWNGPNDILSRLQLTSCGQKRHDGCQGGWPHWGYAMMGNYGIVSSSCIPYYIQGAGTEHFEHKERAPPCESHCQGGYHRSIQQDSFTAPGMQQYDWVRTVYTDRRKHQRMMESIFAGGPIAFSMQVRGPFFAYLRGIYSLCGKHDRGNHAMRLYGWGVHRSQHYYYGSNSWGPDWGMDGHFLVNQRCIVDAFIPGNIQRVNLKPLGVVHAGEPRDPYNPEWPWPARGATMLRQCALDQDGCVIVGSDAVNSTCVSDVLNGRSINVVSFDTEAGYDFLTVNGRRYTGAQGNSLQGLVVDDQGLKFETDNSVPSSGFRLCPAS